MRNMILAALALTSLVPDRHADACGFREPVVYRVSSHYVPGREPATDRHRTFALTSERAPAKLAWRQLAPQSYDPTAIADGTPFANPVTLTLVGPSGTRVVASRQHVFLSHSWDFEEGTGAIALTEHGDFAIALAGSHATAKWLALVEAARQPATTVAWVKAQGVTPFDGAALYTSRLPDTDIETVTVFPEGGTKTITLVRRGTTTLGRFDGRPLGAFTLGRAATLVLADGATVQTISI